MFEEIPTGYGDLMTIAEWEDCVESGTFIDYDGCGHFCDPVMNQMEGDIDIKPSMINSAIYKGHRSLWTHIIWFNR